MQQFLFLLLMRWQNYVAGTWFQSNNFVALALPVMFAFLRTVFWILGHKLFILIETVDHCLLWICPLIELPSFAVMNMLVVYNVLIYRATIFKYCL